MDIRNFFGVANQIKNEQIDEGNSSKNKSINSFFKTNTKNTVSSNTNNDKINDETHLAIYTDGSTFNNGSKKKTIYGGIGVFFGPDDPRNISQGITENDFPPNTDLIVSNNTCELLAVIRGVEKLMFSLGEAKLNEMLNLRVYSDSEYLINSITKWYKNWEKNGWKRSDKKSTVKNKYLIQTLKKYVDRFKIKLIHVKAHQNPPNVDLDHKLYKIWYGNKMADKLAREASKKQMN